MSEALVFVLFIDASPESNRVNQDPIKVQQLYAGPELGTVESNKPDLNSLTQLQLN